MNSRKILAKSVSFLMILFGLYHLVFSSFLILFVYPRLFKSSQELPKEFHEGLVEKAIVLYVTTIIDGLYGAALMVRPGREVKTIHILAGLIIFVFSIFFVTRNQLTADPISLFLTNSLNH
jgi:TRAP-type uncharacterized transport system fused permease subunit